MPLSEDATPEFIKQCFHGRILHSRGLSASLFRHTGGNPLYLRALLFSMVSSKAIKFDFDMQLWRQDLLLSANVLGIDVKAYLDGLLTTLPVASRPILEAKTLACLPSDGFPLDLLAELLDTNTTAIESAVRAIDHLGFLKRHGDRISFAHDQHRVSEQ